MCCSALQNKSRTVIDIVIFIFTILGNIMVFLYQTLKQFYKIKLSIQGKPHPCPSPVEKGKSPSLPSGLRTGEGFRVMCVLSPYLIVKEHKHLAESNPVNGVTIQ
jgi:hypothetical protein